MAERQATGRPRRGERRLITRAQLLDAAERVFARGGLLGASVDAIALEAGYSTGAVYSNFKGKEDLFLTGLSVLRNGISVADSRDETLRFPTERQHARRCCSG